MIISSSFGECFGNLEVVGWGDFCLFIDILGRESAFILVGYNLLLNFECIKIYYTKIMHVLCCAWIGD